MSILSLASRVYNANNSTEDDMDSQMVDLAQGAAPHSSDVSPNISFYNPGTSNGGTSVAGMDTSTGGIDVNLNRDDSSTHPIGGLDFNFDSYKSGIAGGGADGGAGGGIDDVATESNSRVYGAPITDSVNVQQASEYRSGGVYTIQWNCWFNVSSFSNIEAIKIVMPIGAEYVSATSVGCTTMMISDRTIRIEPTVIGGCSTSFIFTISESDYDSFYRSFANYMKCKDAGAPIDAANTLAFARHISADGNVTYSVA